MKIPYGYQEAPPESAKSYATPKPFNHTRKHDGGPAKKAEETKASTPKAPAPRKKQDRGQMPRDVYVASAKAAGVEAMKQRVLRVFADGPLTVWQIKEKEEMSAYSNTRTLLTRWHKAGLIKIVGEVGVHPGVQKLWDSVEEKK